VPSDALFRSLTEDAIAFVVTIASDFTVGYANPALGALVGHDPATLVGRSIVDFLHPDDLERALLAVSGWGKWGAPAGATSFRVLLADGSYAEYDVTAATVTDGDADYFAVYGVPGGYQHATEAVLSHLLTSTDRADALRPVLDVFDWAPNDAQIAIAWFEPGVGHRFVSTGVPGELTGASRAPGEPWATVRSTLESVHDVGMHTLDAAHLELARAHGRGNVWVVPVVDATSDVPALITVWTRVDGPPPIGHTYGMNVATTYVDLILRWYHQAALLDAAARTDALTGLANRRAFFEALDAEQSGGALLFCDLDGFKPINDERGHHVGDEVLRQVADRLRAGVRGADVVARTGGDEFVVLTRGVSPERAAELADRLARAIGEPFDVDGSSVHVTLSVGLAHSDAPLTEATLAEADRALLAVKATRRGPGRT